MKQISRYPEINTDPKRFSLSQDIVLQYPDPAYTYCLDISKNESTKHADIENSELIESNNFTNFDIDKNDPTFEINNNNDIPSISHLEELLPNDQLQSQAKSDFNNSDTSIIEVKSDMENLEPAAISSSIEIESETKLHPVHNDIPEKIELPSVSQNEINELNETVDAVDQIATTDMLNSDSNINSSHLTNTEHVVSESKKSNKKIKDFYSWLSTLDDNTPVSPKENVKIQKPKKEKTAKVKPKAVEGKLKVPKKIKSSDTKKSKQKELFDYIESSTIRKDEVISETLAAILAQQGHKDEAIVMYEKLKIKYPRKIKSIQKKIDALLTFKK